MNTYGIYRDGKIIFESDDWMVVFDEYLKVMRANMNGYLLPYDIWMVIIKDGKISQYERLITHTQMKL